MEQSVFPKSFKEEVEEAMALKGMNVLKLSEATNIPEHYLTALVSHQSKNLPPPPYTRGYILKMAEVLNLDGGSLWQSYSKTLISKTSGSEDILPFNRFALKPVSKAKIAVGIVVLFAIIYFGWRAGGFFGTPAIEITNPATDNFIIKDPIINLTGKINPQDKLTINGEEVTTDGKGYFEKYWDFHFGPDNITAKLEFKVKRLLGKEVVVDRQIIFRP
ncbi:MAG: helix-turn-helix domain-containing protein [Candidatus Wolfebacteria bacterium]|nr:helix-turn-helix domain-containing protein [Candidatus Wolfebacteria bacterium]